MTPARVVVTSRSGNSHVIGEPCYLLYVVISCIISRRPLISKRASLCSKYYVIYVCTKWPREACRPGRQALAALKIFQIFLSTHQFIELRRISEFDGEHPALAIGVVVDQCGVIFERLVHSGHLAADRGKQF